MTNKEIVQKIIKHSVIRLNEDSESRKEIFSFLKLIGYVNPSSINQSYFLKDINYYVPDNTEIYIFYDIKGFKNSIYINHDLKKYVISSSDIKTIEYFMNDKADISDIVFLLKYKILKIDDK